VRVDRASVGRSLLARASIARALDRPRPRTTHTRPSCSKQMMDGGKRRPVRVQHVSARDRPLAAYSTAGAAIGVGVRALRLHRLGVPHRAECTSVPLYSTFSVTSAGPACVCARRPLVSCNSRTFVWLACVPRVPPLGGAGTTAWRTQGGAECASVPHTRCCRRDVPPGWMCVIREKQARPG